MTIAQKRKAIAKIQAIESDIITLEAVRLRLASAEYASATLSSGGGSRSYTRADISRVRTTIADLKSQLSNLRKLLRGESQALGRAIYTVYL
jgi:hypothetical protein